MATEKKAPESKSSDIEPVSPISSPADHLIEDEAAEREKAGLTAEETIIAAADDDEELYSVLDARRTMRVSGGKTDHLMNAESESIPQHQIEFIHDVPLTLSVEIGRTQLSVREILSLGVNAVIQFPKVVGEPMDITISKRLMARGESGGGQ